ncbi:MAG: putative manganese transporter [Patescibacteria group bacterium]
MEILNTLSASLQASVKITLIIFILMVVVELLVLKYKEKILQLTQKNKFLSYITASFFGSIPGCVGTFAMDSLYMAGLLGFGGIIAAMVATSGDEAFLLIAMALDGEISFGIFLGLTAILFLLGILAGFIGDFITRKNRLAIHEKCEIVRHEKEFFNFKHFLKEHVCGHILKKHLWQIFLWLLGAIFVIELLQNRIDLEGFFRNANVFHILLAATLVGVLPISGPNVVLVMLFAKGLIPFSVLLANSIVQDGHGLLPILGFSLKDALKIKGFNLAFGLFVGGLLLLFGF